MSAFSLSLTLLNRHSSAGNDNSSMPDLTLHLWEKLVLIHKASGLGLPLKRSTKSRFWLVNMDESEPLRRSQIAQVVHCKKCGNFTSTTIIKEPGPLSWANCGALCLMGCWFGCCLIPLCMDSWQDSMHHCKQCHEYVERAPLRHC
mmetsp:Transcript_13426/g.25265  ORF Transcript_13426/g.25265 Transcript_13426/m.25265 type:complete len:146 (+) Transcript_13426:1442-1879(+)